MFIAITENIIVLKEYLTTIIANITFKRDYMPIEDSLNLHMLTITIIGRNKQAFSDLIIDYTSKDSLEILSYTYLSYKKEYF